VEAHPQASQSQSSQKLLRLFHQRQLFLCDGFAIGDAGGQAGGAGLVPGGQVEAVGQGTDVPFGQTGGQERALDAQLRQGTHPRPVVTGVVHVGAVHQGGETGFLSQSQHPRKQRLFAVVAPVGGIGLEGGQGEHVQRIHQPPDAQLGADGLRPLPLPLGQGGGDGGDRQSVVPQSVLSGVEQEGGVHTAGEGHGH